MLPDTATLSERLRVCLQEGDENPRDFTTLFDLSIYQLDTTSLPKVIKSVPRLSQLLCTPLSVRFENTGLGAGGRGTASAVCRTCSQTCEEVGRDSWESGAGLGTEGTASSCQFLLCSRLCIGHLEKPACPVCPGHSWSEHREPHVPETPLSKPRGAVTL